jgi:Membrane transporters of cations and cationic drugs
MNIGYVFLAIAIISEVTGSTLIKYTDGFTKFTPSVLCLLLFGTAVFMLSKTVEHIPLYIAYGLWGALGIVLVCLISVLFLKESINLPTIFGICLIVSGVILVNLYGSSH